MDNQVAKNNSRPKPVTQRSSFKHTYLLAYNAVALALWTILTGRALIIAPWLQQHNKLYALIDGLWPLHPIAQAVAILEVIHAATGIVRAATLTTAMQVASRILVVFGILYPFPEIVSMAGRDGGSNDGGAIAFTALIFAHGITEIIRYGFFVWKEGVGSNVPGFLLWLRYNTFFVLYPLGISSECWLIYLALDRAKYFDLVPQYDLFLKAVLLIYIPGSYILYTHMMVQRRRVLKGKGKQA